jgi:uncharacterized protein YgbK (DUF1537 family)
MEHNRIKENELLDTLPLEWPEDLLPKIQSQIKATGRKVVVLDDDPTGTQTVHNIPVLTEWPVELLTAELENNSPAFYLLTNSRALPLAGAKALNATIGRNLVQAAQQANRDFVVVSRSDSTLRGHFPGEVESLAEALEQTFHGWIVLPYFLEGGRYTVNDIHYVAEGEGLIPAGQTEFARDEAFGYQSSNLREWVAEKMDGRVLAQDVASISIDDIRRGGPEQVTKKLTNLPQGSICVVNAAAYRDLEVFVSGLLTAEAQNRRFLYRTAASFVRVRAGLGSRPVLTRADLNLPEAGGGLIVVGSYVPKSTRQVQELLAVPELIAIEISVEALLEKNHRQSEIDRVAEQANEALQRNQDVMIYTGRKLISSSTAEGSLAIGQQVSEGLVAIVRSITTRPRYLLAKGGITSSDVATRGLGIKQAMVLGQILPGVPVWQAGNESRRPGLTYIVFPGNVGSREALAEVVAKLKSDSQD